MMKKGLIFSILIFYVFLTSVAFAQTEITWYGHASFKIQTPKGKILLIDPWITNPLNKDGNRHLEELTKVDLILLTHAHGDHVGNSVDIAKKTGAKLVATFDLGKAMVLHGGFPENQFGYETTGNFGGEISLLDGEVKVLFVPASHSSGLEIGGTTKSLIYAGNPGGFVVSIKNGPVIYHTGDTDLFSDMKLIREFKKVDIMMISIGDRFTMGPTRAAVATKWISPKVVIPMHYATFPVLTGKYEEFEKELKKQGVKSKVLKMNIGEAHKF
ncbi:MAG: metal-dependent hydrolase [Thermodesulfovibrionales bacterium]|nr:metal-dependent hydrolase [Thermodesulfovibrionales bacterium]